MKHYIVIKNQNNKYYFQLWYCGKQEMGTYEGYPSYDMCKKKLDEFKEFIEKNKINNECKYLKLIKKANRCFIYQFVNENNNVLYTSREIEIKQSCKDSMLSTCKNIIDAEIKEIHNK